MNSWNLTAQGKVAAFPWFAAFMLNSPMPMLNVCDRLLLRIVFTSFGSPPFPSFSFFSPFWSWAKESVQLQQCVPLWQSHFHSQWISSSCPIVELHFMRSLCAWFYLLEFGNISEMLLSASSHFVCANTTKLSSFWFLTFLFRSRDYLSMMENQMCQMFERLGFSTTTANAIICDQGIDSLEEVCLLKSSEVETLCKTIHHPGGTIRRRNQDVPNPSISVSALA